MTNNKALVLCSGGVDSTTLLARAVSKYGEENVYALSISYGQKHAREIEAARTVAAHYGVQQRFLDLGAIFADSDCSLLAHSDAAIPEFSYAEQQLTWSCYEGGEAPCGRCATCLDRAAAFAANGTEDPALG